MNDLNTYKRRPTHGRSVALVPFLFGVTGRRELSGAALRRLLEDAGLTPEAARALLARMRRNGQLVSERRGREVDYRLAGAMAEGFARASAPQTARRTAWSGAFHGLLYQVPEKHRSFRDELRRTALLSGYGLLQQGVLIAINDRSGQLAPLLAEVPTGAQVWPTTIAMAPGDASRAAFLAWDLADLAQRYDQHIERLCARMSATPVSASPVSATPVSASPVSASPVSASPVSAALVPAAGGKPDPPVSDHHGHARSNPGGELMRAYAELLAPAVTDTLRQSGLPHELLPDEWPGRKLQQTIDRFSDTFGPAVESYVGSILAQR